VSSHVPSKAEILQPASHVSVRTKCRFMTRCRVCTAESYMRQSLLECTVKQSHYRPGHAPTTVGVKGS
jgi:hypothetical protein